MNIEKALEHFKWKFENRWKPTKKDIEAFNSIIDFKQLQEQKSMYENSNLAKLWIFTLISLNRTELYSSKDAIKYIDSILERTVYDWVKELHKNIKVLNFNAELGKDKDYKNALLFGSIKEVNQQGERLINEKNKDLWNSLTKDIKEENIIKFVNSQITRIINQYEK